MKKIFITGTSGFIGRNLLEELEKDYTVIAPKHSELDLQNGFQVRSFLAKERPDVVIHAANVNTSRNIDTSDYDSLNGNLQMFYNLEKCHDLYGKMYYFGSGAEYDMQNYIPKMKEEFFGKYIPKDSYGFSKYIMSRQTENAENIYDLRLFGVYGKYEEWERRFISNSICRVLYHMPITLYQNVYFDYLWIDDLVKIMKWFIENKPQYKHYNVCSGKRIDLLSLAEMVRECTQSNFDIIVKKQGYKREYTGDNSRLLQELGGICLSDYKDTICSLIAYYQLHITEIDPKKFIC